MGELIEQIKQNGSFLLACVIITAAMILAAKLSERFLPSRRVLTPARRVTVVGMCAAIATVLYMIDFPVPFIAPPFYKLDFSEVPVMFCGFFLGPSAGIICMALKVLLKLLLKGTTTAFVGDLANFVVGCAFVLPAVILYHTKKSKKTAILGMVTGTVVMAVFGTAFNAVYLIPKFSELFHLPLEQIISMGALIHGSIDSVYSLAALCVAPLNIVKGVMISVLTLLLYKHVEKPLLLRSK